jgi:hypothetical protein
MEKYFFHKEKSKSLVEKSFFHGENIFFLVEKVYSSEDEEISW